ncbi:MAG: hypothetical protein AAF826_09275 [Pseudomonadota bacterium]
MENTSRPTALLFGCALAVLVSLLSLYGLATLIFPGLPMIGHTYWITPTTSFGSATALMLITAAIYTSCAVTVFKGDERGRALFLLWACLGLAVGLSVEHYSPFVIIEAALANLILLAWFVPGSSKFLVPNPHERLILA